MVNVNEFINQLICDTEKDGLAWDKISYTDYKSTFDSIKENDDTQNDIYRTLTAASIVENLNNLDKAQVWACNYNGVYVYLIKTIRYSYNVITNYSRSISLISKNDNCPFAYELDLDSKGIMLLSHLESKVKENCSKVHEKRAMKFIENTIKNKND